MKTTRLEAAINDKFNQWDREAAISAARAIQAGEDATLVTYPTGKQMMRFAEPYGKYGRHFEVAPEVWSALKSNGGKVHG